MGSSTGRSSVAALFLLVAATACGGARPASQGGEPHVDRTAVESVVESWVAEIRTQNRFAVHGASRVRQAQEPQALLRALSDVLP
jgi:hypothetical protein